MTWQVTLGGSAGAVLPNGLAYEPGAVAVLSDAWYGNLSEAAVSSLAASRYLGSDVSWTVTIASGVSQVCLPNGISYSSGASAVLSDEQYSVIRPGSALSLFSSSVMETAS